MLSRRLPALRRPFARLASNYTPYDPLSETDRLTESVDVCIVGGGPAGLSAAIRLAQLSAAASSPLRIVVLEKAADAGAHVLSGAVIEPSALDALLPDWRASAFHSEHAQPVTSSGMRLLMEKRAWPIPHPPQMSGKGSYVVSLSRFAAYLAEEAEALGVEVYPGFAGAQLLLSSSNGVLGVTTHDAGLSRQRTKTARFEPGMAFRARTTLLAEGAHGSLTKQVLALHNMRKEASHVTEGMDAEPQTYGIGLKEVWRVPASRHTPGKVVHTLGWPLTGGPTALQGDTYGGGWVYHMRGGLVSLGLVVGLDYKNPWMEPYREFQRMKHHPYFRALLGPARGDEEPPERLAYGARALTEGGLQSLPRLHFPGGALLGCAAGVVNTAKIKGTHNAMRTGMLAAEAAFAQLSYPPPISLHAYSATFQHSPVFADLWAVRNVRPSFNGPLGVLGGVLYSGVDTLLNGRVPWTFRHHKKGETAAASPDAAATLPAARCTPIAYPPFEPPLSTDLMTSVALTGTNHAEGQPVHLRVMRGAATTTSDSGAASADSASTSTTASESANDTAARRRAHVRVNVGTYAGLLGRACPAGVYEYVEDDGGRAVPGNETEAEGWEGKKLVINSQNCIHCKLCDIKVPTQDITWTVPEGGGGPKYSQSASLLPGLVF
ncbi:FAD/NAD(P)-binding domain-containing protein [Mycena rebaudengoi]|nr:FAD/NAD(P)-binding domain-containing protein [Mycena rebaudengoi]